MVATETWHADGTWCEVLTADADDLPDVAALARARVAAVVAACSLGGAGGVSAARASELAGLGPGTYRVSPVLADAVAAALRTADFTGGLVVPGAHWRGVGLDPPTRTLTLPDGPPLDLAGSARAWAADWVAGACADELGVGCLANIGGAIAVRGMVPDGGWQVEVDEGHAGPQGHPVISVGWAGGLATAVTPSGAGAPARSWRAITVAARTCERASAACAAAVLLGDTAPRWLSQRELPARLVHTAGVAVTTSGWPGQRWIA